MKFINFIYEGSKKIGILFKNEAYIIEINSILEGRSFKSIVDLIKNISNEEILKLKEVVTSFNNNYKIYELEKVKLCAPIENPIHDVICVGVNYRDHLEETKRGFDKSNFVEVEKTVYFSKRAKNIIGSGEVIEGRFDLDEKIDYEVELAIIIGKEGKNISKDKAEEYIFGYSIFNDISSRDLQQLHGQWYIGKSLDTYSAMGPCILYKDSVKFPIEMDISSSLNGEIRQKSNTKMLIKDIPSIIEELSKGMTLEPGDIIATGTPAGVGMGFDPPKFMKKGDTISCEISEIGRLINKVE